MSATVYCLASAKGGSGKTTIAATLALFLAQLRKDVLLIDCDEATGGLSLLYLEEVRNWRRSANVGVYGLFEERPEQQSDQPEFSWKDSFISLYKSPLNDYVRLLPSTYHFQKNHLYQWKNFEPASRVSSVRPETLIII
jgi:cellulose biosynthesis protein BcsQ